MALDAAQRRLRGEAILAKYGAYDTRDVVNFMLFDADNPSSVYSCLATARRNARAQRTALTREMWESLNSAWIEFSAMDPATLTSERAAAAVRLDQGALGAVPRRAAQHHPAQRHVLLQPARHLPGARRQHGAHPRREVLRAAAAQRDWSAARSTACSGRRSCAPSRRTAATAGSTRTATSPGGSPTT